MRALRELPGVGATKASKLVARKRPRLRPIWDSVVTIVTGAVEQQWELVRLTLRDDACTSSTSSAGETARIQVIDEGRLTQA